MKKLKSSGDYIDFIAENCDVDRLWLIGLSNQAKKEQTIKIFDDIDKVITPYNTLKQGYPLDRIDLGEYEKLKKRHLSTFQKKSDIIVGKQNPQEDN